MGLVETALFIYMRGIYKITNPKGRVYVGESLDIEKRWNQYKNRHYNKQWKLARSIDKYGWDSHEVEVLEECEVAIMRERERYWQLHYNSIQQGLNLKLTGIGDIKTEDSMDVRKNRSKGQTGRVQSEETKKKLSEIRKGVAKPIGFGEKVRQRVAGTTQTDLHKQHIAESKKKKCLVEGVLYASCKDAAELLGIPKNTLHNRLWSKNYPNCFFI